MRNIIIIAGAVFSLFWYLGINTPMFADDFTYSRVPLLDAFGMAWELFFSWGGRILGHFWMVAVHALPVQVTSCLIAFCICLLFGSIHLLTYGVTWKSHLTSTQLALPVVVFWLFLPEAWETTLWKTGAYYTIASLSGCMFLIPFRFLADGQNCFQSKWAACLFILFSFITPFWVEIIIAPALFLAAAFLLFYPRPRGVGWPLAAWLAFLAGSLLTLFAPGNFVRADIATAFEASVFIRAVTTLLFKYFYTVAIPTGLFFCFAITYIRTSASDEAKFILKFGWMFFVASVLSVAVLSGGGSVSYRAMNFSFILVLVAMNMAYGKYLTRTPIIKIVPVGLIILAIPYAILTCFDYKNLNDAALQRNRDIAPLKEKGEKVVFLKELPPVRQRNFLFLDSLRGNPLPWGSELAAKHGLDNAYLLMDEHPESISREAAQKWQGSLSLTPSLTLQAMYVANREAHTVLAVVLAGESEQVEEMVFLTSSDDSPVRTRIARLFLPSIRAPGIVISRPQQLISELLDRTVLTPGPNTILNLGGTALYYVSSHPSAGMRGPVTVALKIRTSKNTVTVRLL